jgi:hypothetical protein
MENFLCYLHTKDDSGVGFLAIIGSEPESICQNRLVKPDGVRYEDFCKIGIGRFFWIDLSPSEFFLRLATPTECIHILSSTHTVNEVNGSIYRLNDMKGFDIEEEIPTVEVLVSEYVSSFRSESISKIVG